MPSAVLNFWENILFLHSSTVAFLSWTLPAVGALLLVLLYFSTKKIWLFFMAAFLIACQLLVSFYWIELKHTTAINMLLLVSIFIAYHRLKFKTMVESDISNLSDRAASDPVITAYSLRDLPPAVRKWLIRSNVIGKPPIKSVTVLQKGIMRGKPNDNWMSFQAEQFINANNPGFVWSAAVDSGFLVPVHARDKFFNGTGNMLIKAMCTIPIADSSGPEIDRGSLMRFLAEMMWFPTAALASYIRWEHISESESRATINIGNTSASGIFSFNTDGDVKGFEGMRYREQKDQFTLDKWSVAVKNYRIFGDLRIPSQCQVTWKLESGDFTWLELEITKMTFDYGREGESPIGQVKDQVYLSEEKYSTIEGV